MQTLANTTILSNFASVDRLDLLKQLHRRLYIPTQVYEEMLDGLEDGYNFYAGIESQIHPFAQDGWISVVSLDDDNEIALCQSLLQRLHHGSDRIPVPWHRERERLSRSHSSHQHTRRAESGVRALTLQLTTRQQKTSERKQSIDPSRRPWLSADQPLTTSVP